MPLIAVDGPDDTRIAEYRDMPEPELMRVHGLFVAEGRQVVRRLIEGRRFAVRSLLLSESVRRTFEPTLALLDPAVPVYVCAARDFLGITGFDIHRGCLALGLRPPALSPEHLLEAARLVVVLEAVANADNVGGSFAMPRRSVPTAYCSAPSVAIRSTERPFAR